MSYNNDHDFGLLVGKTLVSVEGHEDGDSITFVLEDGSVYQLIHTPDCCESVSIDDINGNLDDLVGTPILLAYAESSEENPPDIPKDDEILRYQDSFTWTFYRISTIKGTVVIRWYGSSNGYYSESVDFEQVSVPVNERQPN